MTGAAVEARDRAFIAVKNAAASGCTVAVTPRLGVADPLGCTARFQLAERVSDRGERHRDAFVLQCLPDRRLSHEMRRRGLQDLPDQPRIGTSPGPASSRTAG